MPDKLLMVNKKKIKQEALKYFNELLAWYNWIVRKIMLIQLDEPAANRILKEELNKTLVKGDILEEVFISDIKLILVNLGIQSDVKLTISGIKLILEEIQSKLPKKCSDNIPDLPAIFVSIGKHEKLETKIKIEKSELGKQRGPSSDITLPFKAYTGANPYIFVSYAHSDKAIVYKEMLKLKEKSFYIWYDEGISPASEWPAEIEKALLNCKLFMVFITPDAIERDMVRNEINFALNHKKRFMAIFLKPTELKYGLNLRMGNLQYIKKYEFKEEYYFQKLLDSLKTIFN